MHMEIIYKLKAEVEELRKEVKSLKVKVDDTAKKQSLQNKLR